MWTWVDDHLSIIITAVVSIVVGFVGGVKMFLGIKDDVKKISERVTKNEEAIKQQHVDSAVATQQRQNMIDKIDETNANVNRLLDHLLDK